MNDPLVLRIKERKQVPRHVERSGFTSRAQVDNLGGVGLAAIVDRDHFKTMLATIPLRSVERDNKVCIGMNLAAGTKTGIEKRESGIIETLL